VLDLTRWPDADRILDEALALPAAERLAFVRRTVSDAELASALHQVLREATDDEGFLPAAGALSGALFSEWHASLEAPPPRLEPGRTVGAYRVTEWIGRGGMGEVYRAHDSSLGRDVALKILPAEVAGDAARLARLRREARLLASLNHPNIGAIYSLAEEDDVLALVLELVEGPTLADRLADGPVPLSEALDIARQIAEGMDAAAQKAVVHRDLKPANIKITPSGHVKVLDFGIARAFAREDGDAAGPEITAARAILGTAAYMSPEQARGAPVDHRTDVWAFGCVLYEMLAGQRAFAGASTADVVARVIEREPDFDALPADLPAPIRRLLRRALEKNPRRRLGYIGDALLEIDEALQPAGADPASASPQSQPAATPWIRPWMWLTAAGVVLVAIAVAGALQRAPSAEPLRLAVPVPHDHEVVVGQLPALAVSRDGRTLVYRAREGRTMRLVRQTVGTTSVEALPGTEDVTGHAMSPDGRSVIFARGGELARVSLAGGAPVRLAAFAGGVGLSWPTPDTVIVSSGGSAGLQTMPASGGDAVAFTTVDAARGHLAHVEPEALPDGRTVLFTISAVDGPHIAVTAIADGTPTLLTRGRQPRYLPSGHLVFARDRALWSVRFDPRARRLIGEPVQVIDGVERSTLNAFVHFAIADDGTLFYIPLRERAGLLRLAWVDRAGRETAVEHERRGITRFSISPDGSRLALAVADGDDRDVWVLDRARGSFSRLTVDPVVDSQPVWSPDGTLIAFRSDRDGGGVFVRRADAATDARRLTRAVRGFHIPYAFTPDGQQVIFTEFRDYTDQDIKHVSIDGTGEAALLAEPFAEMRPALSPDGRWLLYQSDESGRAEVYLRPFPDVRRARWPVSVGGGLAPAWRADGREIYFVSGGRLMALAFAGGPVPRLGEPVPLFEIGAGEGPVGPTYEVSKDGGRFLLLGRAASDPVADRPQVWVIQHWLTALERAAAAAAP
jgi:serine/threonine-protein kinase